jgi:hypothetical protein
VTRLLDSTSRQPKWDHRHPSTSTTFNQRKTSIKKTREQFEKIKLSYLKGEYVNLERAYGKFLKIARNSKVFEILIPDYLIVVKPIPRGGPGLAELAANLNEIEYLLANDDDQQALDCMSKLKTFYEQFMEWHKTYNVGVQPHFTPQGKNKGRINLLNRPKGRHTYGN